MFVMTGNHINLGRIAYNSATRITFHREHMPADSMEARLFQESSRYFQRRPDRLGFSGEIHRSQFRTYVTLKFSIGWQTYIVGVAMVHRTDARVYTDVAMPTTYGHLIPRKVQPCLLSPPRRPRYSSELAMSFDGG